MNLKRIVCLLALGSSMLLAACGGGGAPTTTAAASAPTSSGANDYTGPAPATSDVQNFSIYFWQNVRGSNRCGACHNATTPAQMPNFARSDDVNLAYAQANTVVNLNQPSQSRVVTKVSGGHNCWLADPNACGEILTTWISNWAGASVGGTGTQVQLVAPPSQAVTDSKIFPASPSTFQTTVYPVLRTYCKDCHDPQAATPQSPYFASSDANQAYQFAIPRMNLNAPLSSRFVSRMAVDQHNCWTVCGTPSADGSGFTPSSSSAQVMLNAIQQFAAAVPVTPVDASLVVSKQLSLTQGTIASGQGRYDTNVIAKYEFQTGTGLVAFDTSGKDPSADLTLSGDFAWAGGWGVTMGPKGGKGQASTSASRKVHDLVEATGEYSVEAWVAPAVVAADKSYMVSYSGGDTLRNFTLGQTNQNYDFLMRTSTSDLNGMPQLATPTNAQVLQASLQHVVLTYDPINGRKIFVNGVDTGLADPQKGGTIANWDDTFALVLGNEVASDRPWQGLIKFVAIHNRALTQAQITQNFNAGVGQRFYLLFDVSAATGVSQGYVMFTVAQYDSASYLFTSPTFISLDASAKPDGIAIKGLRVGINGSIPTVGQAYIPLDTQVTAANYTAGAGQLLSKVGTVIAISSGPLTDQFFLSFDTLGTKNHVTTEPVPIPVAPTTVARTAAVGVRTFAQINATLSSLTGVPVTNAAVAQTYATLQQQLPADSTLESFSSANQVGVAQLAIQYCNVAANTPSLQSALFGTPLGAASFSGQANIDVVTGALAARVLGSGITSQPAASTLTGAGGELDALVTKLCSSSACNNTTRVVSVAAAVCAAALGSADALMVN